MTRLICLLTITFTALFSISSSHMVTANTVDSHQEQRSQLEKNLGSLKCSDLLEFQELKNQINLLQGDVHKIIKYTTEGPGKGTTYHELAYFCDTFGPRMSGSKSLENAFEYLRSQMQDESGLQVNAEQAMIPNWELVSQSCEIVLPVAHKMRILTLGQSVSTNGFLKAQIELVHSFDELNQFGQQGKLEGKIVVYNYKFTEYEVSVKYRTQGALRAAKYGAVAALVRSVTPFSINSPHAGAGSKSIPTAAITIEDANLIERWIKRNKTVVVNLNIETRHNPDAKSYNLVGDIKGKVRPEEVVFVSGHVDSWYPTSGAMDDGGGMMISYKALDVLSKLKLTSNRTMRAVLFTAEEPGLVGAQQYFEAHKHELNNFKAVIESDLGTFKPLGLGYKNVGPIGKCVLQELLSLTSEIETTQLDDKFEGSDIGVFTKVGVPGLSLKNANENYFHYHHTDGDTMDLEDPQALDRSTALFASAVYVLANLDVDLRK